MDWGTHVVLAAKLLEGCGCDKGAAIYSVIPVIDREPAHYHRVYAHILENQPGILDVAMTILTGEAAQERDYQRIKREAAEKTSCLREELAVAAADSDDDCVRELENRVYSYERISTDAQEFITLAEQAVQIVGDPAVANISDDKLSAGLSLISHTYFDTYNNPVQVFLPDSAACSAQWNFWEQIDYMKFRGNFYKSENIMPFRQGMADSEIWEVNIEPQAFERDIRSRLLSEGAFETKLRPEEMIKAMIVRLGEMAPGISYEAVERGIRKFCRYMEFDKLLRPDKEIFFCRQLEGMITSTILENYRKDC